MGRTSLVKAGNWRPRGEEWASLDPNTRCVHGTSNNGGRNAAELGGPVNLPGDFVDLEL